MILTLNDMLGPNDQARELQLQQYQAYDEMSEHWQWAPEGTDPATAQTEAYRAACAKYEATVQSLLALLGADAPCSQVDSELYSTYSDCYKSDMGFRPRGDVTCAQARAYLAAERTANPAY